MGAKAIKLARFMGQKSCRLLGLECHVWHMRDGINVLEYIYFFKPGELMRMMYYSVSDTGILVKKNTTFFVSHK